MEATDQNNLTFRLEGTSVPSGEIGLDTLARFGQALQELATRVARHVVGQHGPGRTVAAAATIVDLRLTGLSKGSTKLDVAFGDPEVLGFDVGIEREIADRFWEVVVAVPAASPPPWTTALIAESTVRLIDALSGAADQTEIARADGRRVTWATATLARDPWRQPQPAPQAGSITVTGRLEKVDLSDRRFRIRDDVGNKIALEGVVDADEVGHLVGQRTTATGAPVHGRDGRLQAVHGAVLHPAPPRASWHPNAVSSLEDMLATTPGPDPGGIADVTEQDIDELLAAIEL